MLYYDINKNQDHHNWFEKNMGSKGSTNTKNTKSSPKMRLWRYYHNYFENAKIYFNIKIRMTIREQLILTGRPYWLEAQTINSFNIRRYTIFVRCKLIIHVYCQYSSKSTLWCCHYFCIILFIASLSLKNLKRYDKDRYEQKIEVIGDLNSYSLFPQELSFLLLIMLTV